MEVGRFEKDAFNAALSPDDIESSEERFLAYLKRQGACIELLHSVRLMIAATVASSQGRHHRRLCNEVIGSFVTFFSFSFLFLFCHLFFCAFLPLRFISFPLSLPLVFTGSNGHKSPQFPSHHLQFLGRKCLGRSLFAGLQAQHNPKRKHSSICGSPNPRTLEPRIGLAGTFRRAEAEFHITATAEHARGGQHLIGRHLVDDEVL